MQLKKWDLESYFRIGDHTPAIPNHSENAALHRGLVDSGQDANSTTVERT